MKYVASFLISAYQLLLSPILKQLFGAQMCRYSPTCSEYAKQVISEKGIIAGGLLATKRILSCQPFAKSV